MGEVSLLDQHLRHLLLLLPDQQAHLAHLCQCVKPVCEFQAADQLFSTQHTRFGQYVWRKSNSGAGNRQVSSQQVSNIFALSQHES